MTTAGCPSSPYLLTDLAGETAGRYWTPAPSAIYLNTETWAFRYLGLNIACPRVGLETDRQLAWSERLIRTLDRIPHDIVLYVQDDYFIKRSVDVSMIDNLVDLMLREHVSHISLVHGRRPRMPSNRQFLSRIAPRAEYRISAQAGLWRTAVLRSYLRGHESVWEFEWYGTRGARRTRDSFFYVDERFENEHAPVIPYVGTGVVHGRWVQELDEPLFAAHGISVDYSVRGFYDPENEPWERKPLLIRAGRRLRSIR